jgi:hypothetical protein
VSAKKNKKEVKEGSSSVAQDEGLHIKTTWRDPIATTLWRRSVPIQAWGSGQPCRHLLAIHVPHEVFMALHSTNTRRRDRKHCLPNWSPTPLEKFRGGPAQSKYKQEYNMSGHQYQPPGNKGRRKKRK